MSKQISLATYSVIVREKGEKDQSLPLTNFGASYSVPKIMTSFLKDLKARTLDYPIYVRQFDSGVNLIQGVLEGAESGFKSEFYNDDKPVFTRNPEDEERIPHFFQFHAGSNKEKGVFIAQKFGVKSIYSTFKKSFSEYLQNKSSSDYMLEFRPHVPHKVFEYLEQGQIKKIVIRKFRVPDDIADKYSLRDVKEEDTYLEMSINTKRGKSLGVPYFLKDLIQNKASLSDIAELDPDPAEDEKISIEVRYRGKVRKINLRDPRSITPTLELTEDDIKIANTGHPEYDSIKDYSFNLLADLREELGLL